MSSGTQNASKPASRDSSTKSTAQSINLDTPQKTDQKLQPKLSSASGQSSISSSFKPSSTGLVATDTSHASATTVSSNIITSRGATDHTQTPNAKQRPPSTAPPGKMSVLEPMSTVYEDSELSSSSLPNTLASSVSEQGAASH
jgi:hypothetical protein